MNERLAMWLESIALVFVVVLFSALALRGLAVLLIGVSYLVAGVLGT